MLKILLASLLFIASQVQAEMTLKHGFYLSSSVGSLKADISGKHDDYSTGKAIKNATVHDGKISNARSFGYNLRYAPKVGFGYEVGLYFTKIKMPTQDAALMNDDNGGYIQIPEYEGDQLIGLKDAVVDSPSSYMSTTDLYLGGLYNFKVIDKVMPDTIFDKIMPYVGLGYAKVKGDWYKSHYDKSIPNDPAYGTKGKTSIDGHYLSAKAGINFNENYNVEIEHAKHKFHADAFRSFDINGSDAEFSRTSINFIYTF